jgi:hypothetical protein
MIASRIPRAKVQLREKNSLVNLDPTPTADQALQAVSVYTQLAFVALYEGDHDETAAPTSSPRRSMLLMARRCTSTGATAPS